MTLSSILGASEVNAAIDRILAIRLGIEEATLPNPIRIFMKERAVESRQQMALAAGRCGGA
jgi:hypothetical protein